MAPCVLFTLRQTWGILHKILSMCYQHALQDLLLQQKSTKDKRDKYKHPFKADSKSSLTNNQRSSCSACMIETLTCLNQGSVSLSNHPTCTVCVSNDGLNQRYDLGDNRSLSIWPVESWNWTIFQSVWMKLDWFKVPLWCWRQFTEDHWGEKKNISTVITGFFSLSYYAHSLKSLMSVI